MPNLEDCAVDPVTATEVAALIGKQESQRLEFKETIANITTYELAKDLASFGNADGGFIVIRARDSR